MTAGRDKDLLGRKRKQISLLSNSETFAMILATKTEIQDGPMSSSFTCDQE